MFYKVEENPFKIDPFKALVSPRPIGWISTRDGRGRNNLAPYSFFNGISERPPMLMFSSTGRKPDRSAKDSIANIRETGVFCANVVPHALIDQMTLSSEHVPAEEDEFTLTGLETAPCEMIDCARVAAAPASFECKLWKLIDLPGGANDAMAIGQVVGVWLDEAVLNGDRVDVTRYKPVGRLGYRDHCTIESVFRVKRPGE